jgi:aminoglycoside phosphotransferase (APT) family kinase protein
MSALWNSPLANNDLVTIAEPIAHLPDLKMMLQATIPGEESLEDLLKSAIKKPNPETHELLLDYMRKTAAGLAAVHQCGAVYGDHIEIGERFAEARGKVQRLAVIKPELEKDLLPLIEHLENLATAYPEERLVPSHGTFNPEQVLIDGERIGFIDFDSQCMAEPALDVGLFRSAIKDTGMNIAFPSKNPDRSERLARLAFLDEIGDIFLHEYESHAAVSRDRVALWEAIDYLRNCLHFWIKVKPAEPDHPFLILEQHLQNCERNHLLEQSQP